MNNLDERSDALDAKMAESPPEEAIKVLVKDANRAKRTVRILIISVILDILLSIGLAYITIQTHHIATQADNNQDAIMRSCEVANEGRANNKALWNYLLSLPPETPLTPEQQTRVTDFQKFIDKTFAPRDCTTENQ